MKRALPLVLLACSLAGCYTQLATTSNDYDDSPADDCERDPIIIIVPPPPIVFIDYSPRMDPSPPATSPSPTYRPFGSTRTDPRGDTGDGQDGRKRSGSR